MRMNKRWVTIGAALILSGCGSEEVKQSKFDLEQRRQIEQENAAREAHVRQEQGELARIREQARRLGEATQPAAPREVPVIQPPQTNDLRQRPLPDPNAVLEDSDTPLARRTVYYDYDAYNITETYRILVESHAKSLLAHRAVYLRIEGNCDERRSREYNLALGQRRADSVKRALTLLGVPAHQILTVSFGSEKP